MDADGGTPPLSLLEDGLHNAIAHSLAYQRSTFGANIANLNTPRRINGYCLRVCRVFGFGAQLNRFTR